MTNNPHSGSSFLAMIEVLEVRIAPAFVTSIDLAALNGGNGFSINGIAPDDWSGRVVSAAGDLNGDGFDEVIIGAYRADGMAGESYVVFGRSGGFPATGLELSALNGTNGFRLDGIAVNDFSGWSVSAAGDVNDDGFDDLIIGAPFADPDSRSKAGESYVVFGGITTKFIGGDVIPGTGPNSGTVEGRGALRNVIDIGSARRHAFGQFLLPRPIRSGPWLGFSRRSDQRRHLSKS